MPIKIVNRCLSLPEFRGYVAKYDFGTEPANKLVLHHTWRPAKRDWKGASSLEGIRIHYEGKGWTAGPHLFVAEDGIWLFTPMREDGVHAGELNRRSIGIEVVGDYDSETWSGKTKKNALGAIRILMKRLGIGPADIHFHHDVSPKSCPGKAITKEWLLTELGESIPIPDWAVVSVNWVKKHKLFEIRSSEDVRDAVKFHRLFQLIKKEL